MWVSYVEQGQNLSVASSVMLYIIVFIISKHFVDLLNHMITGFRIILTVCIQTVEIESCCM